MPEVGLLSSDRRGDVLTAVVRTGQRAVVRLALGALRPLWAAAYGLIVRATAAYLRTGEPGATVYLRGSVASGEPLYGSADIDLAVVVPAQPGRPGVARQRAHERWRALTKRLPPLETAVQVKVYENDELRRAASATTHTEGREDRLSGDEAALRLRPGLGPPTSDWRRIAGTEVRPSLNVAVADPHLAAWLELQWWWRLCFSACRNPYRRHIPYLCLKLITQSARVRLWLEQGEIASGHTVVLARARATMPDEEGPLRRAEHLWRELPRSPDPPLAEALGFLLRTTAHVADRLAGEGRASDQTPVRLLDAGVGPDRLALAPKARAELRRFEREPGPVHAVPLADWRARTPQPLLRNGRVDPPLPDEALAVLGSDPAEPAELSELARISDSGLRAGARWGPLLVLPSSSYFAWLHRSVQFEYSDPVSFALLAGERRATFPNLRGWSAADCARRALDAHAFWLQRFPSIDPEETGTALGLLFGAARAALFSESLDRGEPELAVTAAGAAGRLAAERTGSATLLEEALGSYRSWRADGAAPDRGTVAELRRLIEDLPAYSSPSAADSFPPVAAGAASA